MQTSKAINWWIRKDEMKNYHLKLVKVSLLNLTLQIIHAAKWSDSILYLIITYSKRSVNFSDKIINYIKQIPSLQTKKKVANQEAFGKQV